MKLNYVKISPAQNMTILITDYVDPKDYKKVSTAVMSYDSLNAEQVGFIVKPTHQLSNIRIEMAGGEFCGNALLSAAAYGTYKGICPIGSFYMDSSGVESSLRCETKSISQNRYVVTGEMPDPVAIEKFSISGSFGSLEGSLVDLNGISHFVADGELELHLYDELLSELIDVTSSEAIGIIPYRQYASDKFEIKPFVYVRDSGSKVFERACGSGSYSLGAHLSLNHRDRDIEVYQPGGVIHVGVGSRNFISTEVVISSEGVVYIDGMDRLD